MNDEQTLKEFEKSDFDDFNKSDDYNNLIIKLKKINNIIKLLENNYLFR